MKILFVMNQYGVCRLYESVLRELSHRGHEVSLYFTNVKVNRGGDGSVEGAALVDNLEATTTLRINREPLPARAGAWTGISKEVRLCRDYLRYFHPDYSEAHKLRRRMESIMERPKLVGAIRRFRSLFGQPGLAVLNFLLRALDRLIPPDRSMRRFFRERQPDLVLFSRLVDPACSQKEYLKACRAEGFPTVACVASWDNLTNKGLIQTKPDRVFVWNEFQKRESERYHRIPPSRVVVTGAQVFDQWFDNKPPLSLEEVCYRVGLASAEPYLLYACSSNFIAPREVEFVRDWLVALRSQLSPPYREIGIVIRPHPQTTKAWMEFKLPQEGKNTVVYPRQGEMTDSAGSKDFYASLLAHSRAIIGINTSALVEGGIFDKPVLTILDPRYQTTQGGTLHFHYLVKEGLAEAANSLSQHVQQLEKALNGQDETSVTQRRRFVKEFLRPRGMQTPATGIFVQEIERMAKQMRPAG